MKRPDSIDIMGALAAALFTAGSWGRWGWPVAALSLAVILGAVYAYCEIYLPWKE